MIRAYFLRGLIDDNILVFRSEDAEELLHIIRRLGASRDKQIRALAEELEVKWYSREYENNTTKRKPKKNK